MDRFERNQNEAVQRRFGTVAVAAYSASNPFVAVYSVRGGVRRGRGTGATEWISMRVTVSHNRRKEEVMRSADRSFDDLFKGFGTVPIKIVNESRKWTGSRMDFSFDAKVGMVSTPIKGFVDVTDKDVTVDADLGWLERLFPVKQTQAALEGRIKGLLS